VLGLYDKKGQLIHVGQAGTGFNQSTLKEISIAKSLERTAILLQPGGCTKGALGETGARGRDQVSEWTHETADGGLKLTRPVFSRITRR